MKRILSVVLISLVSLGAFGQSSQVPQDEKSMGTAEIMQADRDFQVATEKRGAEGWASFFAEQGIVTLDKPVIGPDAIREAYKGFLSIPGLVFKWHPEKVELMPSGTKGYTVGRYEITRLGGDGKPHTRTGSYLTVWEKQSEGPDKGKWKVIYDTGSPDKTPN